MVGMGVSSVPIPISPLQRDSPTVEMKADASGVHGWGGHSTRGEHCQSKWWGREIRLHINRKEVLAAHRSLECMMLKGDFVHMSLDNKTAVSFINRMGGTRSKGLCSDALKLWHMVLKKKGWIKAVWVPRELNQLSDMLSKSPLNT